MVADDKGTQIFARSTSRLSASTRTSSTDTLVSKDLEKTLHQPADELRSSHSHTSADAGPGQHDHIITTGQDVSNYLVDVRDDGGSALTFRAFALGTVFAGLGATLCQIYHYKPVQMGVSVTFLQLIIYTTGRLWDIVCPKPSWVDRTRFAFLSPVFSFLNPGGKFSLKEHAVASLIASTAASNSNAISNFAVQRLYYNTRTDSFTVIMTTFSAGVFGYGLVGLLRPFTVYPSDMVYWHNLHTISIFQTLHFHGSENRKRLKMFWLSFTSMFFYEIVPAYMFPTLNGVSAFCLASQHASSSVKNFITNLFGGANANEGLGLLSLSFDWQYIGSNPLYLPLVQQANSWIGYAFCYIAVMAIYYSNTWNSKSFPMLSSSIFASNGTIYNQTAVFGPTFSLNSTALSEIGLPALTGSNAWHSLTANLSIGGLIAHCILFWGPSIRETWKNGDSYKQDRHYIAMQRYKEAPWWWYIALLTTSFVAGLAVVIRGQTTVTWWAYIVALLLGSMITPFSIMLTARLGHGVYTSQLMKMVAGILSPGKPVANLYFSMWSHEVVMTAMHLSSDLKMGQYLKVPPRVMFVAQLWGTCVGSVVSYVVMSSIVDSQREVLLKPNGSNVWSGQSLQMTNSAAVTWSLARELYGFSSRYWIVPWSLLIGMIPTSLQWLIWKKYPKLGPLQVDNIVLPVIYMYSALLTVGVTSAITSSIIVGLVSQLWLRKYHPRWYTKYNYLLGGALNGGAQVMVFILSFAVFGASGSERPFPHWAGNPAKGHVDHCNGNDALSKHSKHYHSHKAR